MRAILICISGPSGVGKGTIVRELTAKDKSLALSVSCTTRPPRAGERNGVDYVFLERDEFERGIARNAFIEYDEHFGHYYGTPEKYVRDKLAMGISVLLEIDVVGALNVKKRFGKDAVTVFIAPPSPEALESRLTGRAADSEEQMELRRVRVGYELERAKEYDYTVVNDDLGEAVKELRAIILKEKNI